MWDNFWQEQVKAPELERFSQPPKFRRKQLTGKCQRTSPTGFELGSVPFILCSEFIQLSQQQVKTYLIVREDSREGGHHLADQVDQLRFGNLLEVGIGVSVEDGRGLLDERLADEAEQGLQLEGDDLRQVEHRRHAVDVVPVDT